MPPTKSKKFSILVAVLILSIGIFISGFIVLKTKTGSASISQQVNYLLGKGEIAKEQKNIDSDNDGLTDQEEKNYQTDPKKADTDGDGYLDGEEVATGYNPTKKAPGDELPDKNSQKPRPLPNNLTKALSSKLSEAVIQGKIKVYNQDRKLLTAQELQQEAGLEQAMQEALKQQIDELLLPTIADYEIKISKETGKQPALDYLAAMGGALGKISTPQKSEMQVFLDAMQSDNFSELEKNRQAYYESYLALKEVAVPADLVNFHKGILGVLWVTNNIYTAIKNINEDPLKTTIAILQYSKIGEQTVGLTKQLFEDVKKY